MLNATKLNSSSIDDALLVTEPN